MRPRRGIFVVAPLAALAVRPAVVGAQHPTPPPATTASTAAAPMPAESSGAIHGVVYDSLAHRPLARATVQIVRAGDLLGTRVVAADASGTFRFDSLAPGRYLVGFDHPLLDLLQIALTPRTVDVGPGGDVVRVALGTPDLARMWPVLCGNPLAPTDSSGLIAGRVRDAADDTPVPNAKVVLTWSERLLGAGGVRTEHRRVPVTTGPTGSYVICGVPAGEELLASAAAPGRATGEVAVEVPARGFVVRDLTLGDTASGLVAAPVAHGTARLTGTVRDSAGRPVRGARASVRGTTVESTAGDDGTFALNGLPAGTRTLEVRAIGYALYRGAVDLAPGRAGTVTVRLDRATSLAPVSVFGKPVALSPRVREFRDRVSHSVTGRFVTAADIARLDPIEVSSTLPTKGMQVVPNGRLGHTIVGQSKFGGTCQAVVILDGTVLDSGDDVDKLVRPADVAGIEVYANPDFAPPEYGGARLSRNGCSVVLVWTK